MCNVILTVFLLENMKENILLIKRNFIYKILSVLLSGKLTARQNLTGLSLTDSLIMLSKMKQLSYFMNTKKETNLY